ncbi:hypothetical protein D3C71_77540 [compost metagenome]
MASDKGLKGFAALMHRGRLLNSAFKREEIRRPAKAKHHEIVCREMAGTSRLILSAEELSLSMYISMKIPRGGGDKPLSASISITKREYLDGEHRYSRFYECSMAEIKSERVEEYFAYGVRLFFDLVYSVDSIKSIARKDDWYAHLQKTVQRNKWRE